MKKQSIFLTASIAIGLLIFSQCTNGGKSLTFYRDNGNFVVSDNYLVKTAMSMASNDIQQLIDLDTAYAKLTQGKCFLLTSTIKLQKLQSNQIRFLDKVTDRKYFDNDRYFVDINQGCFERQDIDWSQFSDLKVRIDAIINKYKPATVNGNISISNNQIATSVTALKEADATALINLTIRGVDAYDKCPPDGTGKINRYMRKIGDGIIDPVSDLKFEQILQNYNNVLAR